MFFSRKDLSEYCRELITNQVEQPVVPKNKEFARTTCSLDNYRGQPIEEANIEFKIGR